MRKSAVYLAAGCLLALACTPQSVSANNKGPCHDGTCTVENQGCTIQKVSDDPEKWICTPHNRVTTSAVVCEQQAGACLDRGEWTDKSGAICVPLEEGYWQCTAGVLPAPGVFCHVCG